MYLGANSETFQAIIVASSLQEDQGYDFES